MLVEILHFWEKNWGSVIVPFLCERCGKCCLNLGSGWTYYDVERAASHLNMDSGDFLKSYLEKRKKDLKKFLRVVKPCPFVTSDPECSIYPARPLACRLYPLKTIYGEGTIECPAKQRLKNLIKKLAQNLPHVTIANYLSFDKLDNSILSQLIWNIPGKKEWSKLRKIYFNQNPTQKEKNYFFV